MLHTCWSVVGVHTHTHTHTNTRTISFKAYASCCMLVCKHTVQESWSPPTPTNTGRGQEGRNRKQSNLISLACCLTGTACRLTGLWVYIVSSASGQFMQTTAYYCMLLVEDVICMDASRCEDEAWGGLLEVSLLALDSQTHQKGCRITSGIKLGKAVNNQTGGSEHHTRAHRHTHNNNNP